MKNVDDLHQKWMQDAAYCKTYNDLGPEYELAGAMIAAPLRQWKIPPICYGKTVISCSFQ